MQDDDKFVVPRRILVSDVLDPAARLSDAQGTFELLSLKNYWTSSVWWRIGFLRIFTVAFLLFLAPADGSNTAGQSFTLT